jgi:hypothetical protein
VKQIQGYKEQSIARGWINNSGLETSLDAKLNAAQQALTMRGVGATQNPRKVNEIAFLNLRVKKALFPINLFRRCITAPTSGRTPPIPAAFK